MGGRKGSREGAAQTWSVGGSQRETVVEEVTGGGGNDAAAKAHRGLSNRVPADWQVPLTKDPGLSLVRELLHIQDQEPSTGQEK